MKGRLIIFSLIISLLIVSGVMAGEVTYYNFEEGTGTTVGDVWGSNDGTANSMTWSGAVPSYDVSGSGGSYSGSFDDTNDFITTPIVQGYPVSYSLWFKSGTTDLTNIFGNYRTGGSDSWLDVQLRGHDGGKITVAFDDGVGVTSVTPVTNYADNNYHNLVITYDGSDFYVYVDDTLKGTDSVSGVDLTLKSLEIGRRANENDRYYGGLIDDFKVYDHILTSEEIGNIYDYGSIVLAKNPNLHIIAKDYYDNSTINNFVVEYNGTNYPTTNGTVIINNLTIDNYSFNVTYDDYFNTTNNINAELKENGTTYNKYVYPYQSEISFRAREFVTNNTLTANFSVNGTQNTTFRLKAQNGYSVVTSLDNHYSITKTFNVSPLDNLTIDVDNHYELLLRLYFKNAANNSVSGNTSLWVDGTNDNGDYELEVFNISEAAYNLTLLNGYYNFTSLPSGFSFQNGSVNTTGSTTKSTIDYYLLHFTVNSISFYFYDEINYTLMNYRNVTIELISDDYSTTYSTTSGTKYADLLSPVEYNIRYTADDYADGNYFFVLVNNTYNILNLTMLLDSEANNVTIRVFDTLQNPLINARVKILKYIVETNSYRLVGVRDTNFQGETVAPMELSSEFYKFIVEYDIDGDGVLDTVLSTSASVIYDNTITLYANLIGNPFSSLFTRTGLWGNIRFTSPNVFTYSFNDREGLSTSGCLYAYRVSFNTETLVNSTCVLGSSGSMSLGVDNTTGYNYLFKGYINKNSQSYYVTSHVHSFDDGFTEDGNGVLIIIILVLTFSLIGFWRMEAAVIFAGLSIMLVSITGLVAIGIGYTAGIFILSLVAAYLISRRSSQ
jgi:hypothetical protein